MAGRLLALLLLAALLGLPALAHAQASVPNFSQDQRQALLAAVDAVKQAASLPAGEQEWQVHLLRASDGSHYVAFSAEAPSDVPPRRALRAVREARTAAGSGGARRGRMRSPVEEWLIGTTQRSVAGAGASCRSSADRRAASRRAAGRQHPRDARRPEPGGAAPARARARTTTGSRRGARGRTAGRDGRRAAASRPT